MGLFGNIFDDTTKDDYDYERLRSDLEDEYAVQSATFSGGFGFFQAMDAAGASDEQLLNLAKKEGFNLDEYKK